MHYLYTTTTGAVNISRTGADSQLLLWYNQFHLPLPLENVPEGCYLVVELSRVVTNTTPAGQNSSHSMSSSRASQSQGSHRNSTTTGKSSGDNSSSGGITSLAWFVLKIDKEALNTSVLTVPFLKPPFIRQVMTNTTTTADAHQGNMHSVATVETTLYRRNGKDKW